MAKQQAAQSLYRGLRLTLTSDGAGRGFLSLSTKGIDARWSDWDLVLPASQVQVPPLASTREAALFLQGALSDLLQQDWTG